MRALASYCLTGLVCIAMASQVVSGLWVAIQAIGSVGKTLLQLLG
jgi:hypothetical protein